MAASSSSKGRRSVTTWSAKAKSRSETGPQRNSAHPTTLIATTSPDLNHSRKLKSCGVPGTNAPTRKFVSRWITATCPRGGVATRGVRRLSPSASGGHQPDSSRATSEAHPAHEARRMASTMLPEKPFGSRGGELPTSRRPSVWPGPRAPEPSRRPRSKSSSPLWRPYSVIVGPYPRCVKSS